MGGGETVLNSYNDTIIYYGGNNMKQKHDDKSKSGRSLNTFVSFLISFEDGRICVRKEMVMI